MTEGESKQALTTNGLVMPDEFPISAYQAVHATVRKHNQANPPMYEQWSGAWNAVSYRYLAVTEYSASFTQSVVDRTGTASVEGRHRQERDLFGFFGSAVSALEATFYGLYAIGGFLAPSQFPLATAENQRNVTPSTTRAAFARAFGGDAMVGTMDSVTGDSKYRELREIRNVLTHRAAPGRMFFLQVGISDPVPVPDEWKVLGIKMDKDMTGTRQRDLARLLTALVEGGRAFVEARM
jgi:hypothetical protein